MARREAGVVAIGDDRERIFDFIKRDDPRAAVAVHERIATQVQMLWQFPKDERPGRVEGTRELVELPKQGAKCARDT